MATEVSICSNALLLLGAKTITSLDDGTTSANLCKQFYPEVRDYVLQQYPWRFAAKRDTLAQDALFSSNWEYAYGYKLPTDCLLVRATSLDDDDAWTREADLILTNAEALSIKYTAKITDTAKFHPAFIVLVEVALATRLAKPITGTLEATKMFAALESRALQDAKTTDAFESTPQSIEANPLADVR